MKFIVTLIFLAASTASLAAPIPPRERVSTSPGLRGSNGFDKQILQLHANQEDFDNGVYYLRIDVAQRKLTNYRLPRATFTNYCGHFRASGGSVGDYKPKSIYRNIKIFDEANDNFLLPLYSFSQPGQDHNDTPVVYSMSEFHPRGTQLSIPSDSRLMNLIIRKCRNMRPYPWLRMHWSTTHSCRWKPEIWHKPGPWRDEYVSPLEVMVAKSVVLHCVNM